MKTIAKTAEQLIRMQCVKLLLRSRAAIISRDWDYTGASSCNNNSSSGINNSRPDYTLSCGFKSSARLSLMSNTCEMLFSQRLVRSCRKRVRACACVCVCGPEKGCDVCARACACENVRNGGEGALIWITRNFLCIKKERTTETAPEVRECTAGLVPQRRARCFWGGGEGGVERTIPKCSRCRYKLLPA